jgi:hypothetical protein
MPLFTAVLLLMTIRIYDGFGVPAADLHTAIRTASNTLADAGIVTDWIECRADPAADRCSRVTGESELVVRLSRAPGGRDAGDALGNAAVDTLMREGALATLYADRIAAHAAAAGADPGTLLGRAAAHEIGHLLMGTTGHAQRGLMRAHWSQADLQRRFEREWRFSAAEAQQLRDRVAARMHAAPIEVAAVVASATLERQDGR